MTRENAIRLIDGERAFQVGKWGKNALEEQDNTEEEQCRRVAILTEEVGEVSQAVLRLIGTSGMSRAQREEELMKELVQVAAVALAWIQTYDDIPF